MSVVIDNFTVFQLSVNLSNIRKIEAVNWTYDLGGPDLPDGETHIIISNYIQLLFCLGLFLKASNSRT